MAAFATLHVLHGSLLLRSEFLGQDYHLTHHKQPSTSHQRRPTFELQPCAKFNLMEIMGGRGLCNGEKGLQQELKRQVDEQPPPPPQSSDKEQENSGESAELNSDGSVTVPEDAFEKEMMGLTGGFPGGEKGLKKFIEENPPPTKSETILTLSP
ncbi:hypothetical protein SESBI_23349 [Sesbania bispinosa]|nr:hypothetical protein SESBI_23349 [Sesbania bispinosa]